MGSRRVTLSDHLALAAKPADKEYQIHDRLLAGLMLRVQPSGARSWVFRRRVDGRPKRIEPRITMRDLVQTTLRLRPDRIVVGEIRDGAGALEMLKAWNTGHDDGLGTLHANSGKRCAAPFGRSLERGSDQRAPLIDRDCGRPRHPHSPHVNRPADRRDPGRTRF